jgi:chromate transport protein ChrA
MSFAPSWRFVFRDAHAYVSGIPSTVSNVIVTFGSVFNIPSIAFGGVMPWAHRVMVEERRWVTPADFTETIGLCQFLPGPNVGNASIVLGKRWFGLRGALVAFLGLMALPFIDLLLAVIRRTLAGKMPLDADRGHLHHRLVDGGHSHRRAVLVMYVWAGLMAFGMVAIGLRTNWLTVGAVVLGIVCAVLFTILIPQHERHESHQPAQAETTETALSGAGLSGAGLTETGPTETGLMESGATADAAEATPEAETGHT